MTARWLVVLLAAAALVAAPIAVTHRPAAFSDLPAVELARRVQGSGTVAWSGLVQTSGALQVPDSDSFATLGELLGEDNQLRVWWRGGDDWRVDRLRSTGETDLFRQAGLSVRWVFESATATVSPVSTVRLPDASDLLPATLGRSLLQGARDTEVGRLATRRVAGIDAPGLRLHPDDPATTVDHVDLWADPTTGLPLRVELYGRDDRRPVLTSALSEVDLATPAAATTDFSPTEGIRVDYEESVDVAAAANAFDAYDLPASIAGLGTRNGADPGSVGVYGRGATTLLVLPLRGQVAGPLRERLQGSAAARQTAVGTLAPVGPVGLLITPRRPGRGSFLLAGTVTPEILEQAAVELLGTTR